MDEQLLAVIVGVVQGLLEWLPVSSEGSVALVLSLLGNADPGASVQFALFLHAGTALAATVYYRGEIGGVLRTVPDLSTDDPFGEGTADVSFLLVATLSSMAVGLAAYTALEALVSELAGGAFVALIGGLLVVTGVVQRVAESRGGLDRRTEPDLVDALAVGVLQGLAILPGISRSGTTVSALLLRGHDGVESLRLSFLLAIPASLGAGVLAFDGLAIAPTAAVTALAVSAVVGYLTVGALVALVRRVAFWGVCVGFGTLALVGGGLLLL
ncbi:undecaprenyl-diphosphate phosphatase [Halorientalis sp.]|uniref:undecaprenyl-diphosphate phosphatase n=1 Tax=Halorientalis sp. TaxID=1931229 RepID=UPI002625D330|nr:undecaprenyl-diphosphate phosphatase [Halorientalis sp.]